MAKYKGTPAGNVIEHATGLIVVRCNTAKKAKDVARFMNNGGCFAGWTPEFFLTPHE